MNSISHNASKKSTSSTSSRSFLLFASATNSLASCFGFGIPIVSQNSLSSINFGFSYGKRETAAENSFNEQYVGINFGIILAPSNFDRWFRKKKLD